MSNLLIIAKHEYRQMVIRRGFLFGTLAIPVGFFLLIFVMVIYFESQVNRLPLGYVDKSGLIRAELLAEFNQEAVQDKENEIRVYPDESSARSALNNSEIQAFFVLPANYPQALQTELYYEEKPPGSEAWGRLDDFIRLNLVSSLAQPLQERLLDGSQIIVIDINSNRQFDQENFINILLPIVAGLLFFVATMTASSYMLKVVAEEKENRTMEIMVTSVSPNQLIGGKTLGLLAASLTQLLIYVIAGAAALLIAAQYIDFIGQLTIPWEYLGILALFFFPAYFLNAGVMVAIGGAYEELQHGQQIAGFVNLIFLLPLFMLVVFFENPSSPLIVLLTLFPPTAFLTIAIRWGLSTVPAWQLIVSWVLLVFSAGWTVWAAVRIFRIGMLQYGQPLSRKVILAGLRERTRS